MSLIDWKCMFTNNTVTIDFKNLPHELATRVLDEAFDIFRFAFIPDYFGSDTLVHEDVWVIYTNGPPFPRKDAYEKFPITTRETLNELLRWCAANSVDFNITKVIVIVS